MKALARLWFEAGMLKKMRRTGYPFLGSGGESVADHCFRASLAGYTMALMDPSLDAPRVALMLIAHDLAEARTGDLNYMNKRYASANEAKATEHQTRDLPPQVADSLRELVEEFNARQTPESLLAHDADQLDMIVELKEQMDLGNPYAKLWIDYALKRLATPGAQQMAQAVLATDWTEWWFEKREELWVRNSNNH